MRANIIPIFQRRKLRHRVPKFTQLVRVVKPD